MQAFTGKKIKVSLKKIKFESYFSKNEAFHLISHDFDNENKL